MIKGRAKMKTQIQRIKENIKRCQASVRLRPNSQDVKDLLAENIEFLKELQNRVKKAPGLRRMYWPIDREATK